MSLLTVPSAVLSHCLHWVSDGEILSVEDSIDLWHSICALSRGDAILMDLRVLPTLVRWTQLGLTVHHNSSLSCRQGVGVRTKPGQSGPWVLSYKGWEAGGAHSLSYFCFTRLGLLFRFLSFLKPAFSIQLWYDDNPYVFHKASPHFLLCLPKLAFVAFTKASAQLPSPWKFSVIPPPFHRFHCLSF